MVSPCFTVKPPPWLVVDTHYDIYTRTTWHWFFFRWGISDYAAPDSNSEILWHVPPHKDNWFPRLEICSAILAHRLQTTGGECYNLHRVLLVLGETFHTMGKFTSLLKAFGKSYPIKGTGNVKASVMVWHSSFKNLLVRCFYLIWRNAGWLYLLVCFVLFRFFFSFFCFCWNYENLLVKHQLFVCLIHCLLTQNHQTDRYLLLNNYLSVWWFWVRR